MVLALAWDSVGSDKMPTFDLAGKEYSKFYALKNIIVHVDKLDHQI